MSAIIPLTLANIKAIHALALSFVTPAANAAEKPTLKTAKGRRVKALIDAHMKGNGHEKFISLIAAELTGEDPKAMYTAQEKKPQGWKKGQAVFIKSVYERNGTFVNKVAFAWRDYTDGSDPVICYDEKGFYKSGDVPLPQHETYTRWATKEEIDAAIKEMLVVVKKQPKDVVDVGF